MNTAKLNVLLFTAGFIVPYFLGFLLMLAFGINISLNYLLVGALSILVFVSLQLLLPSWAITVPTFKHSTKTVILLLFVISFSGFLMNLQNVSGNIINILKSGNREYELTFMQGSITNLLYFLNQISAPIMLICFLISGRKVFLIFLTIAFFTLIFHGTRSSLIYPLASCIISFAIIRGFGFLRTKKGILIVASAFIMFQLITVMRNIVEILSENYSFLEIVTYRNADILFYLAGGFINLNEELKLDRSLSYGIEQYGLLIKPFQSFWGVDVGVGQTYALWDEAFNVGTALRASWRDFGYIGVLFLILVHCLILIFTAALHQYFKSVFSLVICAISGSYLLFMFFSDQFLKPLNIYLITVLIACCVFERFVWKSNTVNDQKKQV